MRLCCSAGEYDSLVTVVGCCVPHRFENNKLEELYDFDFIVKALRTTRVTTLAAIVGIAIYIAIDPGSYVVRCVSSAACLLDIV